MPLTTDPVVESERVDNVRYWHEADVRLGALKKSRSSLRDRHHVDIGLFGNRKDDFTLIAEARGRGR